MTFPKDPFTRKTYGRIVVHDEKDVAPVFEILKAIDPEEVANYMPDNLIAPIGTAGAANAALFAVALLANEDPTLRQRLEAFRAAQTEVARNMTLPPAA